MEISLATNNQVRPVESVRSTAVLPAHISDDPSAKDFLALIEEYYTFLNTSLGPSHAISNLIKDHDVDVASGDRLDAIERFVASAVPKGRMDRRRLLKNIAQYYNSRGSESSVISFFKIFYNEVVTVVYPKEFLFSPSSGKSLTSDRYLIRDSYRWQEYSYQVGSYLSDTSWKDEYLRFVHPAGLKFFIGLTLESIRKNDWYSDPPEDYNEEDESDDYDDLWTSIDWSRFIGMHSPRIQPGVDAFKYLLLKSLLRDAGKHYVTHIRPIYGSSGERVHRDLLRAFYHIVLISYQMVSSEDISERFRKDWQVGGKFRDYASFGEFGEMTILEAEEEYDPGSGPQFNSFSPYTGVDFYTRSFTEITSSLGGWVDPGNNPITDTGTIIGSSAEIVTDWNLLNQSSYFNSFTYGWNPQFEA